MTVPEGAVRQTVTLPSRSVEQTTVRAGLSIAPILAIVAGGALAVVGVVGLFRAGVNETWFRPTVEVLEADHTAMLAALEIGVGVALVLAGLTGSRILVAVMGLGMALVSIAVVVDPAEVQRELAFERWWAWVLAAAGVVLTLAALQAPLQRTETRVDVTT